METTRGPLPVRTIAPLFTWRSAIAESTLPPTTRHVLLTLSTYMNERGGSAYPGSARLAKDSGLHQDTVKAHLKSATESGWIKVLRKGGSDAGGKRLATEYAAAVPGVVDTRWSGRPDRGSSSADRGSTTPPISSVITPENSRGVSQNPTDALAPDPNCVRCHGKGRFYAGQSYTDREGKSHPFEASCNCASASSDAEPAPPPWVEAGMTFTEWRERAASESTVEA